MSIWSSLFATKDIVEKGVDAVISAGDKLVYTDEEKMDMKLKIREHHLALLKASEPFKVAQRLLALWFSFLFGVAFIIGLIITLINIKLKYDYKVEVMNNPELANTQLVLLDTTQLFALVSAFSLGVIMITIVAFYFGGGTINSLRGK